MELSRNWACMNFDLKSISQLCEWVAAGIGARVFEYACLCASTHASCKGLHMIENLADVNPTDSCARFAQVPRVIGLEIC